ncbi:uncharacterized protein LOC116468995 [Hylobates moloch]|uniref:uncharacterized protein LOC116468995 n=1 Tax=Hylobates moloch TaxID=81572 RepID=UPI0026761EE0|nr:uncharacterized protein LOC116468995 [Hylobates moloch]
MPGPRQPSPSPSPPGPRPTLGTARGSRCGRCRSRVQRSRAPWGPVLVLAAEGRVAQGGLRELRLCPWELKPSVLEELGERLREDRILQKSQRDLGPDPSLQGWVGEAPAQVYSMTSLEAPTLWIGTRSPEKGNGGNPSSQVHHDTVPASPSWKSPSSAAIAPPWDLGDGVGSPLPQRWPDWRDQQGSSLLPPGRLKPALHGRETWNPGPWEAGQHGGDSANDWELSEKPKRTAMRSVCYSRTVFQHKDVW